MTNSYVPALEDHVINYMKSNSSIRENTSESNSYTFYGIWDPTRGYPSGIPGRIASELKWGIDCNSN